MSACVSCNAPSQWVATLGAEHECYACGQRWQGLLELREAPALPESSEVSQLVRSAARYVHALAVLPVDAEYESRVDKMLAARRGVLRELREEGARD